MVVTKTCSLGTPLSLTARPTLSSFPYRLAVSMCLYPIFSANFTASSVALPGDVW